jgi:hypothetical protein
MFLCPSCLLWLSVLVCRTGAHRFQNCDIDPPVLITAINSCVIRHRVGGPKAKY